MFLKKKAHNLFAKSIKVALKNVRGSVSYVPVETTEELVKEAHEVVDETVKPKKVNKTRKNVNEDLVDG